MPGLDTNLHLDMLRRWQRQNSFGRRLSRTFRLSRPLYGLDWGDPDVAPPLQFIKQRYVAPFVNPRHVAIEIGPGGGRWTRYLIGFHTVFAVDYHPEVLDELKRNFRRHRNVCCVKNDGTDFPGIAHGSIDYIFSFGAFVHLEFELIEQYLRTIRLVAKPGANIVIQYSDKTKIMGQLNHGFSDNTPERMRAAVHEAGYRILDEDTTTLWHSSVIRFTP